MMHPGAYQVKVAYLEDLPTRNLTERVVHKGIVEMVGHAVLQEPDDHEQLGEMLMPGNIVYYRDGVRIEDSVFIDPTDIISYDRSSEQ